MGTVKKVRKKSSPRKKKKSVGIESELNEAVIPSGKSKAPDKLEDYVISIYGNAGCGKTSLAAQFPGYVVAAFEPHRKGIEMRKVDIPYVSLSGYEKSGDYRPFQKFCSFIEQAMEDPSVKGIAIDTFNLLFQSAEDFACDEQGIKSPNDANDYGKTWRKIQSMVRDIIMVYRTSEKGLVFIDHSVTVDAEENNEEFRLTQPNLRDSQTGSLPIIKESTDMIIYYGVRKGGNRFMQIQPSTNVFCKSNIDGHFMTPKGEQLKQFDVGGSPQKAYQDLKRAFNNELNNPVPKTKKRGTK